MHLQATVLPSRRWLMEYPISHILAKPQVDSSGRYRLEHAGCAPLSSSEVVAMSYAFVARKLIKNAVENNDLKAASVAAERC